MPVSLKHSTNVVVADDGVSPVGSDEWNLEHSFTMDSGYYLGRQSAGNGPVEQVAAPMADAPSNGTTYGRLNGAWAGLDTVFAKLASPALTGTPTAPTAATADSSTALATTAFVKAQSYLQANVTATISVGFTVSPYNAGTVSSGTFTPAAANGNYQYYTNNGAHTLAAPAADCGIDVLVTNGATAGAITFSGFSVGANIGDPLTTTNLNRFLISIRRIATVSTYSIKALQ